MPTVADVLREYGPAYLSQFGQRIPSVQRKVIHAIAACRTGQLGTVVYRCEHCQRRHAIGRSCGNRHCPTCQQHKTKAWLENQLARLLPCHYFMLTFTVPASLRAFVRSHPRLGYAALFEASAAAIRALAADSKYIGSNRLGFTSVLHTWGRTLDYHPHLHVIVPGGAISQDGNQWLASRPNFLIPVKAASQIYRAKFREAIRRAGLLDQIPPGVWEEAWVVHSTAVGDGSRALKYLAPYVFRVAISDARIKALTPGVNGQGEVTFGYRRSGSRRWRSLRVSALEFIRRFLQHVLPTGLQKVRHYGFNAAPAKKKYENIRWICTLAAGIKFALLAIKAQIEALQSKPPIRCAECGGPLQLVAFLPPPLRHVAYQDTS